MSSAVFAWVNPYGRCPFGLACQSYNVSLRGTPADQQAKTSPMEMLTIKECTEAVKGISEHTIRKLATQGRVRYIRTGEGERGKILICKQSLLDYLGGGK